MVGFLFFYFFLLLSWIALAFSPSRRDLFDFETDVGE